MKNLTLRNRAHLLIDENWKNQQVSKFTDLVFILDNNDFVEAHSFVLGTFSAVIANIMKLRYYLNTDKHILTMKGVDGSTMRALIQFLYTGKVNLVDDASCKAFEELVQLLEIKDISATRTIETVGFYLGARKNSAFPQYQRNPSTQARDVKPMLAEIDKQMVEAKRSQENRNNMEPNQRNIEPRISLTAPNQRNDEPSISTTEPNRRYDEPRISLTESNQRNDENRISLTAPNQRKDVSLVSSATRKEIVPTSEKEIPTQNEEIVLPKKRGRPRRQIENQENSSQITQEKSKGIGANAERKIEQEPLRRKSFRLCLKNIESLMENGKEQEEEENPNTPDNIMDPDCQSPMKKRRARSLSKSKETTEASAQSMTEIPTNILSKSKENAKAVPHTTPTNITRPKIMSLKDIKREVNSSVRCLHCDKHFTIAKSLKTHLVFAHFQNSFKRKFNTLCCEDCKLNFPTADGAYTHYMSKHDALKDFLPPHYLSEIESLPGNEQNTNLSSNDINAAPKFRSNISKNETLVRTIGQDVVGQLGNVANKIVREPSPKKNNDFKNPVQISLGSKINVEKSPIKTRNTEKRKVLESWSLKETTVPNDKKKKVEQQIGKNGNVSKEIFYGKKNNDNDRAFNGFQNSTKSWIEDRVPDGKENKKGRKEKLEKNDHCDKEEISNDANNDHLKIPNDKSKQSSKYSLKCFCDSEKEYTTYTIFKLHLTRIHFFKELTNQFSEYKKMCPICSMKIKMKSQLIEHLAVAHHKVIDFCDDDIVNQILEQNLPIFDENEYHVGPDLIQGDNDSDMSSVNESQDLINESGNSSRMSTRSNAKVHESQDILNENSNCSKVSSRSINKINESQDMLNENSNSSKMSTRSNSKVNESQDMLNESNNSSKSSVTRSNIKVTKPTQLLKCNSDQEESTITCLYCDSKFVTSEKLSQHLIFGHFADTFMKKFMQNYCNKCKKRFPTVRQCFTHQAIKHNILKDYLPKEYVRKMKNFKLTDQAGNSSLEEAPVANNMNNVNAENDEVATTTKTPIVSHSIENDKSNLECDICDKTFTQESRFLDHMSGKHFKTDLISKYSSMFNASGNGGKCQLCPFKTNHTSSMVMHLGTKHKKVQDLLTSEKVKDLKLFQLSRLRITKSTSHRDKLSDGISINEVPSVNDKSLEKIDASVTKPLEPHSRNRTRSRSGVTSSTLNKDKISDKISSNEAPFENDKLVEKIDSKVTKPFETHSRSRSKSINKNASEENDRPQEEEFITESSKSKSNTRVTPKTDQLVIRLEKLPLEMNAANKKKDGHSQKESLSVPEQAPFTKNSKDKTNGGHAQKESSNKSDYVPFTINSKDKKNDKHVQKKSLNKPEYVPFKINYNDKESLNKPKDVPFMINYSDQKNDRQVQKESLNKPENVPFKITYNDKKNEKHVQKESLNKPDVPFKINYDDKKNDRHFQKQSSRKSEHVPFTINYNDKKNDGLVQRELLRESEHVPFTVNSKDNALTSKDISNENKGQGTKNMINKRMTNEEQTENFKSNGSIKERSEDVSNNLGGGENSTKLEIRNEDSCNQKDKNFDNVKSVEKDNKTQSNIFKINTTDSSLIATNVQMEPKNTNVESQNTSIIVKEENDAEFAQKEIEVIPTPVQKVIPTPVKSNMVGAEPPQGIKIVSVETKSVPYAGKGSEKNHRNGKASIQCTYCDKPFSNSFGFLIHQIKTHFKSQFEKKYLSLYNDTNGQCPYCSFKAKAPKYYFIHLGYAHQKAFEILPAEILQGLTFEIRKTTTSTNMSNKNEEQKENKNEVPKENPIATVSVEEEEEINANEPTDCELTCFCNKNKLFNSYRLFKKHMYKQHYSLEVQKRFPRSNICPICEKMLMTVEKVYEHLAVEHNKVIEYCNEEIVKQITDQMLPTTSFGLSELEPTISNQVDVKSEIEIHENFVEENMVNDSFSNNDHMPDNEIPNNSVEISSSSNAPKSEKFNGTHESFPLQITGLKEANKTSVPMSINAPTEINTICNNESAAVTNSVTATIKSEAPPISLACLADTSVNATETPHNDRELLVAPLPGNTAVNEAPSENEEISIVPKEKDTIAEEKKSEGNRFTIEISDQPQENEMNQSISEAVPVQQDDPLSTKNDVFDVDE